MSPGIDTPALAAFLLEATVKGSLLLAGIGLLALALRHRSAAERHLVWTIGVVALLLLPALLAVGPEWPVALPHGLARVLPQIQWRPAGPAPPGHVGEKERAAAAVTVEPTEPRASGSTAPLELPADSTATPGASTEGPGRLGAGAAATRLFLVWLTGALVILAWVRLVGVARRATPLNDERWTERVTDAAARAGVDTRRVGVRRAAEPVTPLAWGILRPVVILPPSCEEWTDEQARTVLVHETSHISRHDCLTQTLASLACVLHWFNPLAWLAARRMLTERERACDDQVLLSGAKASDYANDLLEIARTLGAPWSTAQVSTAMARRSQIAGRLLAVLDPDLPRGGARRAQVALAALGAVAVVLPLAAVQAASPPGPVSSVVEAPPAAGTDVAPMVDLARAGAALHAQNQALAAALRRGDTEGLSRFYTADAELVVPLFPVARGRSAIGDLYEHLVTGGVTVLEHTVLGRYRVGSMVCEIRTSRLRHRSGSEVQTSREMTLWKREDGEWRVHREVSVPVAQEE